VPEVVASMPPFLVWYAFSVISFWVISMNRVFFLLLSSLIAFTSGNLALAKDVQVKGYTKKDGTVVAPSVRHIKDKDSKGDAKAETKPEASTTETSKTETKTTDSKGKDTVEVKGYTKKDGTKVAGYTRKKPSKSK
jgi:hypothetical protein